MLGPFIVTNVSYSLDSRCLQAAQGSGSGGPSSELTQQDGRGKTRGDFV